MKKLNKRNIIIPIVLLVILSITFITYKTSIKMDPSIPYKKFITDVNKGIITDVYISDKENMKITYKDGKSDYTENPRTINLKETLLLKGINVHEGGDSNPLDAIPLIAFFIIMISVLVFTITKGRGSKGSAFKLSTIDVTPEENTSISFNDIAGNLELKESIKELVDFLKSPDKYSKYDARMPRGVILYGPPGTGKTLMAKALASEAKVPFYAVNGSEFVQVYVGIGAGRIRDLFKKAREKGKAVIFIDEIDAIGKKRDGKLDGGSDERDQTLNALLAEMSGFNQNEGIIVLAATNRMDVLDEALLRPGRFDRHLEVGLPDINARHQILKLHSDNKPISSDVDLFKVAQMTVYFSGAKLEHLMNEAAILAAQADSEFITMEQIDKSYSTVLAGAEKKDKSYITEEDRKITAYHEAGHALVSKLVCPENIVRKITIIPSTKGAGGYTLNIPPERMYKTKRHLFDDIKIALGGRAAEEVTYGKENITTGAYGDLQQITKIILAMVKGYGMFDVTGLLNYEILDNQSMTNSTEIINFCNNILSTVYSEVIELLSSNLDKLESVSNALLNKETIYDDELNEILALEKVLLEKI
jgi:cell division protease FtsH